MLDISTMIIAGELLSGSCMESPEFCLNATLEAKNLPEYTGEELDQFIEFLDREEIYECELCGWWTYPGTRCDCEDICETCENEKEWCTCGDDEDD